MSAGLWEPAVHSFPTERLDEFLLWAAAEGVSDIAFQRGAPAHVESQGRLRRAWGARSAERQTAPRGSSRK